MAPGKDPFKFMMEIDRFAADLYRLDRSVAEVRKCVIIVAGLSADYEIECRIFISLIVDGPRCQPACGH